MSDFFLRTEEIKPEEISRYFVETNQDRLIVNALKSRTPVVVVGSRGVGKSFLLRVAETEHLAELASERVFPVYVTLTRSSLIQTSNTDQFQHWMLATICSRIIRALGKSGILAVTPKSVSILAGSAIEINFSQKTKIESIAEQFEDSWKNPGVKVDTNELPSIDSFKDAIEDICNTLDLSRISLFIDEAAHIFLPSQQRQFFTLFRDLRSPYLTCNAAVYPGVTSYGETFQPAHDATMLPLDRDILNDSYVSNMREIVEKQADSNLLANIARNAQNFAIMAYAASGNPRILLKTLSKMSRVNSQEVNHTIREFYRTDIWAEHSQLAEKYLGHRFMIDWGRRFIEDNVLPELQRKNAQYLNTQRQTGCFFWIHRDAPQPIKEALRLLAYTGIVDEHSSGVRATRSEIGTRYMVNLGCLFSREATPASTAFPIVKNMTVRRMNEYGHNHPYFQELIREVPTFNEPDMSEILERQLDKSIDILDITDWQRDRLRILSLNSIGDVLRATEDQLQQAPGIGEKRSRRMRNAAITAVFEYLSG